MSVNEVAETIQSSETLLRLTPKAVEAVKKAIAEEGIATQGLRVAVQGGGCSGLQ